MSLVVVSGGQVSEDKWVRYLYFWVELVKSLRMNDLGTYGCG